jgi:hypothetical protein
VAAENGIALRFVFLCFAFGRVVPGIFVFVVIQRLASSLTASWDISKSSTRAAYQVPF